MSICKSRNVWDNFKDYSKNLDMPIREFQEAFSQTGIFAYGLTQKLLNLNFYTRDCGKRHIFPFVYYSIVIYCIMAILRCILNFETIIRERESPSVSRHKRRISLSMIFKIRLGCQVLQLISYISLFFGLILYEGPMILSWMIIQASQLAAELIRHLWNVIFRKEQLNLLLLLSQFNCWLLIIFVLSVRNFFDKIDSYIKEILWF